MAETLFYDVAILAQAQYTANIEILVLDTLDTAQSPSGSARNLKTGDLISWAGLATQTYVTNAITALNLGQYATDGDLAAEVAVRLAADNALGTRIDDEALQRIADDEVLNDAIVAEISTRAAADIALDSRLDAIEADYTTSTELTAALAFYETTVHANATFATITDLGNETTARTNADIALDGRLDTVETLLSGIDAANIAYKDEVNAFVARQTITAAALAGVAETSILTLTQTWNTTGAPSAFIIDITDTASDPDSNAIQVITNGFERFAVTKEGVFTCSNQIMESVEYGFTGITSNTIAGFSVKEAFGPHLHLGAKEHIHFEINDVNYFAVDDAAFHPITNNTMTVGTASEMFASGYFTTLNLGHATDTPFTRVSPGVAAIGGSNVLMASDVGVSIQAYDADLGTLAGLTATTDNFIQSVGSAWASRTPTQATATLINFVGDSGAGGTKGLVPAPAAGDALAGKYLDADGTWTVPPSGGGGDVFLANNQTFTGTNTFSKNGATSTSALEATGTVFAGGSAATTFPLVRIVDSSVITTSWNTSGTYLGVNAKSTFTGRLLDLQLDGSSKFYVNTTTVSTSLNISMSGTINSGAISTSGTLSVTSTGLISGPGASSVSALRLNGTVYAAGSGSSNYPHIYVWPAGASSPSTWSTAGTVFGANPAAGFVGNFLDLHINGGVSVYSVNYAGAVACSALTIAGAAALTTANISDIDFANSWDGVTTIAPSKDALYDYFENYDLPIARISANWYLLPESGTLVSGSTLTADTIYWMPFVVRRRTSFTDLAVRVSTLSVAGNFQLAIYACSSSGRPTGSELGKTGSLSTALTGSVSGTLGVTVTLEPGIYFAGLNQDNGTSVFMVVTGSQVIKGFSNIIGSSTLDNILGANTTLARLTSPKTFGTWGSVTSDTFTESTTGSRHYAIAGKAA